MGMNKLGVLGGTLDTVIEIRFGSTSIDFADNGIKERNRSKTIKPPIDCGKELIVEISLN